MALTEQEELELLELENENALKLSSRGVPAKTVPEMASSLVTPPEPSPTAPTAKTFPGKISEYLKRYSPFPTSGTGSGLVDYAKRLFHPVAGQAGPARALEETGRDVERSVIPSAERIATENPIARRFPRATAALTTAPVVATEMLASSFRPSTVQQNIGPEAVPILSELSSPVVRKAASSLAIVPEWLTGTSAKYYRELAANPKLILPEWLGGPKPLKEAGTIKGAIEKKAGWVAENVAAKTKKGSIFDQFKEKRNPFDPSQSVAQNYYEKIKAGEKLAPPETLEAYTAANEVLNKTTRKDPKYVEMLNFKDALKRKLISYNVNWGKAIKGYAESKVREMTTNLLPRTATGKPSIGRTGFTAMLTGAGARYGSPGTAAATLALSSPATYGVATALGSASGKVAGAALKSPLSPNILRAGIASERVRVRNKQTGQTGTVSKRFLDPNKYEVIQ